MAPSFPASLDDGAEPPQRLLDSWLRLGVCLTIAGACILPLIPVWRAALTVIAIAWLMTRPGQRHYRAVLMAGVLGAGLIYGVPLLLLCLQNPAQVFIGSVQFPYGLPVNMVANTAQLFGQLAIALVLAIQTHKSANRYYRLFVASCSAFAIWAALSGIWNAVTVAADQAEIILAGATTWVDWAIAAMLSAAVFRDSRRLPLQLAEILCFSATLIAVAIMAQWAIGDYSYVLTTIDSAELFARTRASYYYHAPATQFIAFCVPVISALAIRRPGRLPYALVTVLCGFALFVNGTRGISLAVVAGLGLLIAFLVATRRSSNLVLPILIVIVLALTTQIIYVKPAAPPDLGTAATGFAESNAARGGLALAGMARVSERPVVGFGPGYGVSVERPDGSGQQLATVSSHVLAIDLAAMGGIPALLAFAAMIGAPVLGSVALILRRPRSEEALISASFVAALAIFALTSFFHPQEHSSIILVALMLAGAMPSLAGQLSEIQAPPASESRPTRRALLAGLSALVFAFVGWLLVTSPSYVFPSLEFVARYGAELRANRVPVYTTNPATNVILGLSLKMAGVDTEPTVLADEPAGLPVQSGYIVWAPADESRYPALRAFLGPALERSYFQWMSVRLLPSWTLINNFQPTVQFIKVGPPALP